MLYRRQLLSSKHHQDQVTGENGTSLLYGLLFASQLLYTVTPPIIHVKPSTKCIPSVHFLSFEMHYSFGSTTKAHPRVEENRTNNVKPSEYDAG
jgi:hypothetical protein